MMLRKKPATILHLEAPGASFFNLHKSANYIRGAPL
ncbi:MAG: hypothetical protein ACD_57C00125G0004, partial [uncultured bacterium]